MAESAAIRYNQNAKKWEFSNDRISYNYFATEDHRHTSAEITDATSNAINNKIVKRGPGAEAAFGKVLIDTATFAATYAKMGRANGISDPEQSTITNFTIGGTTSNFKTTVQDGGAGKVNLLWNATKSENSKYLVGNEAAAKITISTTSNGIGLGIFAGAPGSMNGAITWQQYLSITDGNFEFGPVTDPYGSIDTGGNVTFRGTMYAQGFETQSERKYKKDIIPTQKEALNILNGIVVYEYTYKSDPDNIPRIGIMADDSDDDYLTGPDHTHFSISNTVGYLVKAVQELSEKIDILEKENAKLKSS